VTITIRPATAADLTSVAEVHTRARGEAYRDIVPAVALHAVGAAALAQWWEQRWSYERETHRMAVAQAADGSVAGFTYVGPGHDADTGELYAIHVDPDRQGGGIGRALMGTALGSLGDLGASRAVLWVLAGNAPARRFYERGGWRGDGAERREPVGPALTRQLRYWRALG
jgi:ribosomal protein S18 acetylase RimI-like enzyme